jgi:serine/threonine protein kinase
MNFEQCALASGLLTQQQIDEARLGIRWSDGTEIDPLAPPSDQQLANRLVETNRLNLWQAKQLLDGRTKFNLGPYRIIDSLGQGGMGQVFKAEHEKTAAVVAVKVLPRDKSTPEAIANFAREIQALSSLHHPKLVSALDAGEDGNVHFLVTEYVPGTDLRKLVRRDGPLTMAAAASIISQVAEGLEYAHQQGIVHRDVKPGNVLVASDGEAKLSDLGLAGRLAAEPDTDPRYGKIVGTADYLSPDHIRDPWNPTPAWDIYSLGCTLYYAVTGKVPFAGGTTADKARAHCELRPLDPRRLNPRLRSDFVEVMADMMAKDPALRIKSAREVITRLAPFLTIPDDAAVAADPFESPWSAISKSPAVPPPLHAPRSAPGTILADTITDFPDVASATIGDDSSSSASANQLEQFIRIEPSQPPEPDIPIPAHEDVMAIIWPITAFILAPLTLIGAIGLLWYLFRSLLR